MGLGKALDGRMRIAFLIGVRTMVEMVGSPVDRPSLDGHRTQNQRDAFNNRTSLKAPMGQEPVETKGNTETSCQIESQEESELLPASGNRIDRAKDRSDDEDQQHTLVGKSGSRHAVPIFCSVQRGITIRLLRLISQRGAALPR